MKSQPVFFSSFTKNTPKGCENFLCFSLTIIHHQKYTTILQIKNAECVLMPLNPFVLVRCVHFLISLSHITISSWLKEEGFCLPRIHANISTQTYPCIYISNTYIFIHKHIYSYTHTQIYTHSHTYTQRTDAVAKSNLKTSILVLVFVYARNWI